jgi:type II secretory pathway component GspD/PulD (secretin)
MLKHSLVLVLAAGLLVLGGGRAEDPAAAKATRTVYFVKHGDAKELAGVLAKHFKGDAEVQAVPDAGGALLISASPAVQEEVLKLLVQLDQPPHVVAVEVLIAEVATKKGDDGKPAALDLKELTGPSKDVLEKVEALKKAGALGSLKRLQLTASEAQPARVVVGESRPFVMGVTVTATGLASRSLSYRTLGTTLVVTPRVADGAAVLDLDLEDAQARMPEDGPVIGKDEAGAPIHAPEFITARLKTKVTVRPEQTVATEGVKTESKSGQAQTLILVSARIQDAGAKPPAPAPR